ncbi:MAG TPA: threonine ammonia-lyase, partial [Clostridiales bacterium]|nr:threonine ammonia-lyase [Clostridiales bacterium]
AGIIAAQNANIIMFQHDRVNADLELDEAIVHVVCEVGGTEQGKALLHAIESSGYQVTLGDNA